MKIKKKIKSKGSYVYDPRIHGISQSNIGCLMACREKARLTLIKGWQTKAVSVAMNFGSLSHAVLEAYYIDILKGKVSRPPKKIDRYAAFAYDQVKKQYGKQWASRHQDLCELQLAILYHLIPVYAEHWWVQDKELEWVRPEMKFKVPVKMPDGETVPLVGMIDGVFYSGKKRRLLSLETKNKARWSKNIVDLLGLDLQVGYYLSALESIPDLPSPSGCVYNLIRRPAERQGKTETVIDFAKRIAARARKIPDHFFERYEISWTKKDIEQHKFRTQLLAEEFYEWWKSGGTSGDHSSMDLLYNSGSCSTSYGDCSELAICSSDDYSNHYIREDPHPELA